MLLITLKLKQSILIIFDQFTEKNSEDDIKIIVEILKLIVFQSDTTE